jgi:thymidylate synthase (FAD)
MNMKKNKIELIGWYGGDEINACSAWTSTSRTLTDEKKARIPKLLKDLASAGHETPFEKSIVHFLIDTEISSHIQACKHRISSMNAESARYKELKEDKYYIPEDWADITASRDVSVSTMFGDEWIFNQKWSSILEEYTKLGNVLYHECLKDLSPKLGRKRAKESARFFKTYNSQIQADIMFNWRSFVNFQKLRNSEHAQKEIREIASEMLNLVKNIEGNPFQHTIAAFNL